MSQSMFRLILPPHRNSVVYLQFCGLIERTKYYAIWTLTEVGFRLYLRNEVC